MALLNFKLGEFKNLANAAKQAGTVYITKDEKAMYVDVDSNTRIRIGDIIQLPSSREAQPPFSTEALYYFIEENALLKWNGTTWKQLNSVSDLQTNISDLQTEVATLKTKVGAAASATSDGQTVEATGLFKDVADLKAEDVNLQAQITKNKNDIAANDKDIADLSGRMSAAEAITAKVTGIEEKISENATNISKVSAVVGDAGTAGSLVYRTDAIEKAIGAEGANDGSILDRVKKVETLAANNQTAIGDDGTAGSVKGRIKVLETSVAEHKTALDKHDGLLNDQADAIKTLQDAVGENAEGLAGKVATLTNDLKTAQENIEAIQEKDQDQDTKIKNAADKAAANETAIGKLNAGEAVEGSVKYAVKVEADARAAADSALQNSINGLASRVGAAETKNEEQDTRLEAVEEKASANATAIGELNAGEEVVGSVDYKIKQAKEALSAEIDKDINAANAMEYKGSISAKADLPSSNVKIGDTYVVGTKFADGDVTYNPGDMLIAKGTEDDNGHIGADLAWNHVKTGYDVANEAKLSGQGNAINLTSHLSGELGDLGKITFVDGGSGVKAAIADNAITLTVEWGSF